MLDFRLCFADRCDLIVYLNHTNLKSDIEMYLMASSCICSLLSLPFSLASTIAWLLKCQGKFARENEAFELFEQKTFENESIDVLACLQLGIDEKISRNSLRGKAGYPVLEHDLPYLELKPFKCLAIGEVTDMIFFIMLFPFFLSLSFSLTH